MCNMHKMWSSSCVIHIYYLYVVHIHLMLYAFSYLIIIVCYTQNTRTQDIRQVLYDWSVTHICNLGFYTFIRREHCLRCCVIHKIKERKIFIWFHTSCFIHYLVLHTHSCTIILLCHTHFKFVSYTFTAVCYTHSPYVVRILLFDHHRVLHTRSSCVIHKNAQYSLCIIHDIVWYMHLTVNPMRNKDPTKRNETKMNSYHQIFWNNGVKVSIELYRSVLISKEEHSKSSRYISNLSVRLFDKFTFEMMIVFVTSKKSLVPLLKGLLAQVHLDSIIKSIWIRACCTALFWHP